VRGLPALEICVSTIQSCPPESCGEEQHLCQETLTPEKWAAFSDEEKAQWVEKMGGQAALEQQAAAYSKEMDVQHTAMREKLILQYGSAEALDAALKKVEEDMAQQKTEL
jgi:hypothetical protein